MPGGLRNGKHKGQTARPTAVPVRSAPCSTKPALRRPRLCISRRSMLDLYSLREARLTALEPGVATSAIVWIDLNHPTDEEEEQVERLLGIDIPTREEMAEIEVSSRLYAEAGALYMTASVLMGADGPDPQTCPVTFILTR